jgi:uncharacterized protein
MTAAGDAGGGGVVEGEAHRQQVERWRRAREGRLQSPAGWLSLVDRVLLDPGDNQLPIGVFTLAGERVSFRARDGLAVTLAGQPVAAGRELRTDAGGVPDRLDGGGRSYEVIRRGDVFAVRVKDPRAPALVGFRGLDHFPIDPAFRVVARFTRFDPPRTTRHTLDIGEGAVRVVPGVAAFTLGGQACTLEPVIDEDGRRLFIVFGDHTNRDRSYPGGRFLYADLPAGDQLVLDFNLAFNPPCAFTAFSTCPAIPAANRLALAVTAGERRYQGDGAGADPPPADANR